VTSFLLDTNVLSELAKPRPSSVLVASMRHIPLQTMFLSDVVLAEIRFGIENISVGKRREALLNWLRNDVRPAFAGRVLPITEDVLLRWRWIVQASRLKGYTFEQSDALLAATASYHGMTVLSRDVAPFERASVAVLNPWKSKD
jgi:predicted nucleic acid-binding protein